MHIKELDRAAVLASVAVATRVTDADLSRPTPCTEWTVANLLTHMAVQHRGFAAAARGERADWRLPAPAPDPVADYLAAGADVLIAFREAGSALLLPEIREQPFPAEQAMAFHFIDYVVHAWDLARAIGTDVPLDDTVLAPAWEVARRVPDGEERRRPDAAFQPGVPVHDGAMLDRIVATLGRDPAW
ncbi:TIGR03086 family metal-binding protein [Amycolatopsis sacchari]|uniref:TIGR03086 family metal-binding protein n=1 Tax=Amycolatopsis sacchari TaxID=115433 RepID=UPI003EB8FD55